MSLASWTPLTCGLLSLGHLQSGDTLLVMVVRPTLQEEFPHLLSIISGLPVGPFVDSLCDLICPGCFPHLGALLSSSFCPVQCLGSFMSQLVPPLHSLKETVFCMVCVVRFYICECVCVNATGCVCKLKDNLRCWSPPSTLLQVCVGVISFLLFAAVYVRLAVCRGEGLLSLPSVCP